MRWYLIIYEVCNTLNTQFLLNEVTYVSSVGIKSTCFLVQIVKKDGERSGVNIFDELIDFHFIQ